MLTIQEVNYFTSLVNKNVVSNIQCPFDIKNTGHFVYSRVDENINVYFRCADCKADFKLGLNSEEYIKNTIDKYKIQG